MRVSPRLPAAVATYFVFCALLLSSVLVRAESKSSSQAGSPLLAPEISRIMSKGKLVVGLYHDDMPPFFMTREDGALFGLDIDLARSIARYLKVDIEFNREARTYQQLYEMVAANKVDVVVAKFSRTFDRAKVVGYTRPYVTLRLALLVNAAIAAKQQIEEYPIDYLRNAGVRIGVKAKTSYVEYAHELFPKAKIVEYTQWSEAVEAVRRGDIVAALYDENEITRSIRQNPEVAIFALVYALKDRKDYISIAVPRQSTQLLAWLDTFLDTFDINEDVQTLITKYPEAYK